MKTKHKLYLILFILGVAFLLQNCRKEELLVIGEEQTSKDLFSKSREENDTVIVGNYNKKTTTPIVKKINGDIANNYRTYVPDDNFEQALIDLGFDKLPLDDYVPTENINTVKKLSISSNNICDLTGIEDFTKLEYLICDSNNLKSLDLSQNVALTRLCCNRNSIKSLDISHNTKLLYLYCNCNLLKTLDVSNTVNLVHLDCNDNNLTSLDVSKNIALRCLFCNRNNLTSLDISNNVNLSHFKSNYNLKLACIQVNKAQLNDIPSGWQEDEFSDYKTVCN